MSKEELYNVLKIKDSMIDELIRKLDEKAKEIERLKEEYIITCEQKNNYISTLEGSLGIAEEKYLRLNNIINELEKWLNEKICLNKNDKDYINGITFVGVNLQMYQVFLDKLQELKGEDKE